MKIILVLALLALALAAEEPKPVKVPTCDAAICIITIPGHEPVDVAKVATEVAALKAQLTSARADLRVLTLRFQYEMQVCEAGDLARAKADALEAAAAAKPKPEATPAK